jgi:hypothetical protein
MGNWWNGKFIFYLLTDPTIITYSLVSTHLPSFVYAFLGISVVVIESFYVVLVWVPLVRTVLLFFILMMHLFIAVSMGLTAFGILLISLNLVCWYPVLHKDILKCTQYVKNI